MQADDKYGLFPIVCMLFAERGEECGLPCWELFSFIAAFDLKWQTAFIIV